MDCGIKEKLSLPIRLRRNRSSEAIRSMVRETELSMRNLVAVIFIIEGTRQRQPILSMPGVDRLSIDLAIQETKTLWQKGVRAVALFPVVDRSLRSECASEGWSQDSLLFRAIHQIKSALPELCVIADVALDPFTSHGHDGLINEGGQVDNDATIGCLIKMALMQAQAGVNFVAPSDMMDGRVGAIREALDLERFEEVGIISYSAKYASALYGPFREALHVELQRGDKKSYQMDPANVREALLESALDEQEGADMLMVKPATYYLDVISRLRTQTNRPIAAYHVSGEYSMVMAAHQAGWLDASRVFHEALLSIKRAGADLIFTYAAHYLQM